MAKEKAVKLTIKEQREIWKKEGGSLATIIDGFWNLEKSGMDYFSKACKLVVASGVKDIGQFEAMVEKANNAALETEMNNRLTLADTAGEIKAIQNLFIHQKTTKQFQQGSFKTSILPNGWRTSVSVLARAIAADIPLYKSVNGVFVIQPKSVLDKLIATKKEGHNPGPAVPPVEMGGADTTTIEDGVGGKDTGKPPLAKLEIMIQSMRHILAELENPAEIEMAKVMLNTVWDLTPLKADKAA
jgi:hypothetical protein